MRLLAVLFLMISAPALAGDYTPWLAQNLAQNQAPTVERRWYCCRHCTHSERPCDGKCVSAKDKCKKPPGCACAYGEGNF